MENTSCKFLSDCTVSRVYKFNLISVAYIRPVKHGMQICRENISTSCCAGLLRNMKLLSNQVDFIQRSAHCFYYYSLYFT
jgi:hypothetical protein